MMSGEDRPPRVNGGLCFSQPWERTAFGVALALAKNGAFEWETFRQNLIEAIGQWERGHDLNDPAWSYYDLWLEALEKAVVESGLISTEEFKQLSVA